MIKITTSKKNYIETIASLSNLLNNILRDYNKNIEDNDKLAYLWDYRVSLMKMGYKFDKISQTNLINKAMDVTKSDPYADIGKYDPLMNIGQLIIKTSMLPTKHSGLAITLSKIFQSEYIGSHRRHAHERDHHSRDTSKEVLKLLTFISPRAIYPSDNIEELEEKPKKKLTFKKRKKKSKSQEEAE